jgi:hypothetical protein
MIPSGVISIGSYAFSACTGLEAINVATNNPVYSSVAGVLFDKSQTTLLQYPIGKIGSYTIPDSVRCIGDSAFESSFRQGNQVLGTTNLTSVTIGSGVTNIGSYAFAYCPGLTAMYFLDDAPAADSSVFYGSPNVTVYYFPGTSGWDSTFAGVPTVALFTTPTITATVSGQNWYSDVFTLTGTVSSLVPLAGVWFQVNSDGWQLAATTNHWTNWTATAANLMAGTNILQAYAADMFGHNSAIVSVNLNYIASFNFTNINGTITVTRYTGSGGAVSIPGKVNGVPVTGIADYAFFSCSSLTSVTIPTNIISIGVNAFASCSGLTNVTLPNGLARIGSAAFSYCASLTSVMIPNSVTNLGDYAFLFCTSLTSVTIPNRLTSLGSFVFNHCASLTNVTIPNTVVSIADYAFAFCSSLTTITIPNSVANIGDYAFYGCSALNGVYFLGNSPVAGSTAFFNVSATTYYLPGTTNWDSTFAGLPTALWLPQVQTSDASFGVQTNQFGFNINWASGQTVVVEACTNLFHPAWQPVQTNTLTGGAFHFSDPQWTNYPGRFYRLRSP